MMRAAAVGTTAALGDSTLVKVGCCCPAVEDGGSVAVATLPGDGFRTVAVDDWLCDQIGAARRGTGRRTFCHVLSRPKWKG